MMEQLFGIPVYRETIDHRTYNKKELINSITSNYQKSPNRNVDFEESNLHHIYADVENPKFEKLNLEIVNNLYKKIIQRYFDTFSAQPFDWNFSLINYTCFGNSQYIEEHYHSQSDYVATHYIKFDPKVHTGTRFRNKLPHVEYIQDIKPNRPKYDLTDPQHAWLSKYWTFDTKEDDFIIHPAILYHDVPPQQCDDDNLRMAIILNIYTENCGLEIPNS